MSGESPGTLIGSYEVIQRLEGQSSEVYLARRQGQDRGPRFILISFEVREVDAKIIQADAERCRQIDHRAIIRLVEMFEHDTKRVLVFDSVPGTSLHRLMMHLRDEGEKLADGAVFHVGKFLFGALAKAHTYQDEGGKSAPIVHGQLGPHQVIVSWSGAIAVMGFGMSRLFRLAESILAEPDELRPFMAPEQRAGYAPTARANIYSGAAMIWSLLANQVPPTDDTKPPSLLELRPDVPRELSQAVDAALEPAITQRTITASEIEAVLDKLATTDGVKELKWNMEVFKESKPAELGFIPPETLPPSLLSDVPAGERPEEESAIPESDGDAEPTGTWKVPEGIGVYSMIGGSKARSGKSPRGEAERETPRAKPKKKLGRPQSSGSAAQGAERQKRLATLPGAGSPRATVASHDAAASRQAATATAEAKPAGRPSGPAAPRATGASAPKRVTKPFMAAMNDGHAKAPSTPTQGESPPAAKAPLRRAPDTPPQPHAVAPSADLAAQSPATQRSGAKAAGAPGGDLAAPEPTPTPMEPVDRVAPLPPPVMERPPVEAIPAEPDLPEDEDDDEGFYVRPSLRPGALSEAPFLTPSLHPAALGGPPFGATTSAEGSPMAVGTVASAFAPTAPGPRFKLSAGGLPLKWTAAIALTAVISFAAGLLVASGPVKVKVGENPADGSSTAAAEASQQPPGRENRGATAPRSAPERAPIATVAASTPPAGTASTPSTAAPGEEEVAGPDGSDLPPHQGYLIVRSREQQDAHVYVLGERMGLVGERLDVSCGLINVRLGDHPLSTWYGKGHAVQVGCQAVTKVVLKAGEALHPGAERGAAPVAKGKPAPEQRYWVPSSL